MSSIFKVNNIVVILQGRHAGKKAVVISENKKGVLVAGINTYPKPVLAHHTVEQAEKRTKLSTFVKLYNPKHLMITRYSYTASQNLQYDVKIDHLKDQTLKQKAVQSVYKTFYGDYLKASSSWLFKKLPF